MYITANNLYLQGINPELIAFFKSFRCSYMNIHTFIERIYSAGKNAKQIYQNFKLSGLCREFYAGRLHYEYKFVDGVIVWTNIYNCSYHKPFNPFIKRHFNALS